MGYGRVLLVDDNENQIHLLALCLRQEGYEVQVARDGETALERFRQFDPQLVILDVMLPRMDGLAVCQEIRKGSAVPIIMCSAKDDDVDKVVGLEVGADDYVTKPYNTKELAARVRAQFRRIRMTSGETPVRKVIAHGDLSMDLAAHRVAVAGIEVDLTPLEFSILECLAGSAGRVVSRQRLLDFAWGTDFVGAVRTVDSHVRNLRNKLKAASGGNGFIESVRGVGYRFDAPA